jgi:HEAT repeat protein
MAKRLLLLVPLLVAVGAVFLDPTYTVRGWLGGDAFYRHRPARYWARALQDEAPGARTNTLQALADGKEAAVPVLLELLRSPDAEVRWSAAGALGMIGPEARAAVPALADATRDGDPTVRYTAADALGKIGPDAREAVPALIALLKTSDRLTAVKALTRLGPAAREAIPALIEALEDHDPDVRCEVCEAFGEMGELSAPAVGPLVRHLKEDEEGRVREHAAEALGEIGAPAKEAVPALVAALKDPDAGVRKDAARSLGQLDPKALAEAEKGPEKK